MLFAFYVLLIIAVAAGISAVVTSALLLRGRTGRTLGPAESPHVDDRLRRIEQTVESLTAEMERLTEGQRFLTDVMTERRGELPRLPKTPPEDPH